MIPSSVRSAILESCDATSIQSIESVQSLWSGYGEIARVNLADDHAVRDHGSSDRVVGRDVKSLIVKWVDPPADANHPRGWSTDQSHQRKLRSYQVESCWYTNFSHRLGDDCRVAKCYQAASQGDQHLFLLEDLDAAGFGDRHRCLNEGGVRIVLTWLAHFHATFLGCDPAGLWPVGTYWHLATRPDELAAIDDSQPLKQLAHSIDGVLSNCPIQTLVHGDAKVANFCFASGGSSPHGDQFAVTRGDQAAATYSDQVAATYSDQVAAVDFQYVGGGCGMKDVAYFLGSCLDEDQCDRGGEAYLDFYFAELDKALGARSDLQMTGKQVEDLWRPLYPIAWADFHRFLLGWCPGHQKLHAYTHRMTQEAIKVLK